MPDGSFHYSYKEMARRASQWGIQVPVAATLPERHDIQWEECKWTRVDRGNLQRIADVLDSLTDRADRGLLKDAVWALGEPTRRERERRKKALVARLYEEIHWREDKHGACPNDLRLKLWDAFIQRHGWWEDPVGNHSSEPVLCDLSRALPLLSKKTRKEYDRWMRKRLKKAPDEAPE